MTRDQSMTIFDQWIAEKQLFQITIVYEYGHRFIRQLDSQQSFADPKRGNVKSTPQLSTFELVSWSASTNFH